MKWGPTTSTGKGAFSMLSLAWLYVLWLLTNRCLLPKTSSLWFAWMPTITTSRSSINLQLKRCKTNLRNSTRALLSQLSNSEGGSMALVKYSLKVSILKPLLVWSSILSMMMWLRILWLLLCLKILLTRFSRSSRNSSTTLTLCSRTLTWDPFTTQTSSITPKKRWRKDS
jgi:hypothetical protein